MTTALVSALPPLYASMLSALRSDAPLSALGNAGVFDEPPKSPAYPYTLLDDPFESPDRTFGQGGSDVTIVLSVYTQSPTTSKAGRGSTGFLSAFAIANRIAAVLTDLTSPLIVEGFVIVDADVEAIEGYRETDGVRRRIDVTLTFSLEATA